ncbi:MAG TPA: class I SAM-dependent methyltransferase [Solirubrobacterales bacterium]|nr:class I SAM-dependent methyltransferase [Solirubrobacterales bacterium]
MASPRLTPLAAAVLHVGSPERILQIECGDGEGALFLAREFPSARVRGVDRSEERIRAAAARVGLDPEGRLAFKVGAPGRLPFPDDHFDLLAALDAAPAAAECARVLRPGGFLAVARSAASEPFSGASGWLLRRRLRHRRFEPIWTEAAGEGSFAIERLRGAEAIPPSH